MNKLIRWALFLAALLAFAAQGAFAQNKGTFLLDDGITVNVDNPYRGVLVEARNLPMKEGFTKGVSIGKGAKTIWPLLNLDIFGKVAIGEPLKEISPFNPKVEVSIPIRLVQEITEKDAKDVHIVILIGNDWVRVEDLVRKGIISDYRKTADAFIFRVNSWPFDDRMMGCDH
jgi:hypothetical protein